MAIDTAGLKFSKGDSRKTVKGRKARKESAVKKDVRQQCVDRDGYCRVRFDYAGTFRKSTDRVKVSHVCSGPSEHAHFGKYRRAHTRGQEPERRHTTAGSLMLCQALHRLYDLGKIRIRALTDAGCDGPLEVKE